jgi:hypothetical protein
MIGKSAAAFAMLVFAVFASVAQAQDNVQPQKPAPKAATQVATPNQLNIKEYTTLLRQDVRSQKSAVMSSVMQLDLDEAAKFWPIYRDYDAELSKVNDMRVANMEEYARTYNHMTDAKADELIQSAIAYQKQRGELLATYYERMKKEMGAITAARFVQVEHQLLLIIDLQIASSLPVAGS